MKKYVLIILTVFSISVSCKKTASKYNLRIDVQSLFNNDKVQVFVDNEEKLNKLLTTNNLLGVCNPDGQINLIKNNGNHQIKVVVNNTHIQTANFTLEKNRYIGINFDSTTKEISFVFSDMPFIYE